MRTYTPLILLFAILFGSAIVNAISGPQDAKMAAAIEAAIAKIPNFTRISKLPPNSVYTFTQEAFDPVTKTNTTMTVSRTVSDLIGGLSESSSSNALAKRNDPEFGYVCETSIRSPRLFDVISNINDMTRDHRAMCCQLTPRGRCYTYRNWGTSSLGICGNWMRCVPCKNAAEFLVLLAESCYKNFRGRGHPLTGGRRMRAAGWR
ncbi:uncharacterized protein H6S33_006567 [Morchella sextelata]|uniref:uncharacterized protein n=1 Tax=Morchella sextelata TaxID=1174677 RepID=UPI001D03D7DB|nr:uncharacterized protein H6S33_006567 [Morchella sextelata]KAH0604899.1 hypothetical protein H6S33_006567 [Morchella sextelata]